MHLVPTAFVLATVGLFSSSSVGSTGLGRAATEAEIKAWDIDVRPDFLGLPPGSGSVQQGVNLWEEKCASCHGTFGESNEVFTPIVGGTTKDDIATGRVAALLSRDVPRTTIMKLSTVSTLWDYIQRAMPWTEPKSLTVDEVYALVAYVLHLSDIVTVDFVLSDGNIADIQKHLPNRLGVTRDHGLWEIRGRPDVRTDACMTNCPVSGTISSSLPEEANGSHGDLAVQFRLVGPGRGASSPADFSTPRGGVEMTTPGTGLGSKTASDLATKHYCTSCHAASVRVIGPSFDDIRRRYTADPLAPAFMAERIRNGGAGQWGTIEMPPQSQVGDKDLEALVQWILDRQ